MTYAIMAMVFGLLAVGTFIDSLATESNTLSGAQGTLVNTTFNQKVTRLNQPTAGDANQQAVIDSELTTATLDMKFMESLKSALMIDWSFFEGDLQIIRWFMLVLFVPVYLLMLLEVAKIIGGIVRGLFSFVGGG